MLKRDMLEAPCWRQYWLAKGNSLGASPAEEVSISISTEGVEPDPPFFSR